MKQMNYLKYFEEYLLKPYKNYEERKEYAHQKMMKILQNRTFNGDLELKEDMYPKIKNLINLEEITNIASALNIFKKFKTIKKTIFITCNLFCN